MNIAEEAINRRTTMLVLLLVLSVGGYICYYKLGWLEDPEYTIKDAIITVQYPGASAVEVEQEVADPMEDAIQELKQLKHLNYSVSSPGLCIIDATIQDKYDKKTLPGVWQQLRDKVSDNISSLPPGAGTPNVNDDFGDVYGILFGLTAQGYTWREMKDYADFLRKEILQVDGVAKVIYWGQQQEAVFLEFSRSRLSEMNISPQMIVSSISSQNLVRPSGQVLVGSDYIRIYPSGEFRDFAAIAEELVVDPASGRSFRIGDFATVRREYTTPPVNVMRYTRAPDPAAGCEGYAGEPALGIGISPRPDANVVDMGRALKKRLAELDSQRPYGMELQTIVFQGDAVAAAVQNFVFNLIMAVVIVVAVLLIFMGLRSGLLIGLLLMLIVAATFVCMYLHDITLQRISLGALIIALGMLVDNGIVIADGMLVNLKKGMTRIAAANQIVNQTTLPLLGGTLVGILAFSAIGLSPDSTGEYCGSLFWVICYSMLWSWLMAITVVPLFGNMVYKEDVGGEHKDPYDTPFYRFYRRVLQGLIRYRWATVAFLLLGLGSASYGFRYVNQSFFPESDQPRFYIDFWTPQGTDIRYVDREIARVAQYLTGVDEKTGQKRFPQVRFVSTWAGSGAPRFTLTYSAEQHNNSYGYIMVELDKMDDTVPSEVFPQVQQYLDESYPGVLAMVQKFKMGASYPATIEARFFGADAQVLRSLADQALSIMNSEEQARYARMDWRQRQKVVRPLFSEDRARYAGVSREDLCDALQLNFVGTQVGLYRESNNLIPILARPQASERTEIDNLYYATVWSNIAGRYLPVQQVVTGFSTDWEDVLVRRRYGKRCLTVQCEPVQGITGPTLFATLREKIENIALPEGYTLEWGGQEESSSNANDGLKATLPVSFLVMGLIVLLLYDAIRQSVVIFLNVPLAVIGVTIGLLVTGVPFGFMALLGFLSLSGMMIKNAIVLVDQIDQDRASGKELMRAIVDSGVSRVRPVALGAATTVLGMLPLIVDPFFSGMAVTICFGLTFATALTLLICPVFYAIFFRARFTGN